MRYSNKGLPGANKNKLYGNKDKFLKILPQYFFARQIPINQFPFFKYIFDALTLVL